MMLPTPRELAHIRQLLEVEALPAVRLEMISAALSGARALLQVNHANMM